MPYETTDHSAQKSTRGRDSSAKRFTSLGAWGETPDRYSSQAGQGAYIDFSHKEPSLADKYGWPVFVAGLCLTTLFVAGSISAALSLYVSGAVS